MRESSFKKMESSTESPNDHVERRSGNDRRSHSRETQHFHLVGGRRKDGCRRSESHNFYVDWHNPVHFMIISGIMLLSVFDALMTTIILSGGGKELNILMDELIQSDIHLFVQVKLALTGLGLILLTRYINFKVFNLLKVSHLMLATLTGYSTLVMYEIFYFI
jgi:hypothetical protein